MKPGITSYRLVEISGGFGETSYDLVKLVMTSYRLKEMSGGFGETSYDQFWTWRYVWRIW